MRISDWSSDVCSSDLVERDCRVLDRPAFGAAQLHPEQLHADTSEKSGSSQGDANTGSGSLGATPNAIVNATMPSILPAAFALLSFRLPAGSRSEERRVGKECVRTCKSRCPTKHK